MANELEKENAAHAAMDFVEDGMTLGLGTGSTAKFFVENLAEEIAEGLVVRGVPTSEQTRRLAESLGVPLVDVEQVDRIHLTVDGADEVDEHAQLIKGGGAALLREKIIANASDLMIVIADSSKKVDMLGQFPLPVEVTPFGYTITAKKTYDALKKAGVLKPMINVRTGPGINHSSPMAVISFSIALVERSRTRRWRRRCSPTFRALSNTDCLSIWRAL